MNKTEKSWTRAIETTACIKKIRNKCMKNNEMNTPKKNEHTTTQKTRKEKQNTNDAWSTYENKKEIQHIIIIVIGSFVVFFYS